MFKFVLLAVVCATLVAGSARFERQADPKKDDQLPDDVPAKNLSELAAVENGPAPSKEGQGSNGPVKRQIDMKKTEDLKNKASGCCGIDEPSKP